MRKSQAHSELVSRLRLTSNITFPLSRARTVFEGEKGAACTTGHGKARPNVCKMLGSLLTRDVCPGYYVTGNLQPETAARESFGFGTTSYIGIGTSQGI